MFVDATRQEFRRYFQPSRVVLCVLDTCVGSEPNIITLCFSMHSGYKPPMMAFAIHNRSYSSQLIRSAHECVLAVPGSSLAEETMVCGVESGRTFNKVRACGFTLESSKTVQTPSLREAIANIELSIVGRAPAGDHTLIYGRVDRYRVRRDCGEPALLSIGPDTTGYTVLANKGIHRLAIPSSMVMSDVHN